MFGPAAANWPIMVWFAFSGESHDKEACWMRDENEVDTWKEAKISFVKNWSAAERERERCVALLSEGFQFSLCP